MPAARPPLKPTLSFGAGAAIDAATRVLADALVAAYDPGDAWEWACAITVLPAGVGPLITLAFRRHDAGSHPSILDAYEFTWRPSMPLPVDVAGYARVVMESVGELRRGAVLERCQAWSRAQAMAMPDHCQTPPMTPEKT